MQASIGPFSTLAFYTHHMKRERAKEKERETKYIFELYIYKIKQHTTHFEILSKKEMKKKIVWRVVWRQNNKKIFLLRPRLRVNVYLGIFFALFLSLLLSVSLCLVFLSLIKCINKNQHNYFKQLLTKYTLLSIEFKHHFFYLVEHL